MINCPLCFVLIFFSLAKQGKSDRLAPVECTF